MSNYQPFPIGTVRGPYRSNGSVHFMVQGPGGWVPFNRKQSEESEVERLANEYAAKLKKNMPTSEKPVRVIFRKWPKTQGGEVFAMFPAIASTVGRPDLCLSYVHNGQHGAADPYLVRTTKPAKPEEYADLKKELERIGYKLTIAHKFTRADLIERSRQIAEHP